MIGTNSIIKCFNIPNVYDKEKSFKVKIQANKNYGICDVHLPFYFIEPVKPTKPSKEAYALYRKAKAEYDSNMRHVQSLRSAILEEFQGRQLNSESVRIHLVNVLYELLN